MEETTKNNGGISSRIGLNFHQEIERLKDKRLERMREEGLKLRVSASKDRMSTEKITNLIIRHNQWAEIFNNILNATEEEVNTYGT